MNLFYRGYVIHEDIRSICYTIFGCRPHRIELGSSLTAKKAMRWVDRHVSRQTATNWTNQQANRQTSKSPLPAAQHAMQLGDVRHIAIPRQFGLIGDSGWGRVLNPPLR